MNQRTLPISAATPVDDIEVCPTALAPASFSASTTYPIREAHTGPANSPTPIVAALRRRVLADITHANAVLASLLDRWSVRCLDVDAQTELALSIAGDRDLLEELADGARVARTQAGLLDIGAQVRRIRPEAYSVGIGHLLELAAQCQVAETLETRLACQKEVVVKTEAFAELTAVLTDLAAASLLHSSAALAATAARHAALTLSASSTRSEIQAVTEQVLRVENLLARIDQILTLVELDLE